MNHSRYQAVRQKQCVVGCQVEMQGIRPTFPRQESIRGDTGGIWAVNRFVKGRGGSSVSVNSSSINPRRSPGSDLQDPPGTVLSDTGIHSGVSSYCFTDLRNPNKYSKGRSGPLSPQRFVIFYKSIYQQLLPSIAQNQHFFLPSDKNQFYKNHTMLF